MSKRIKQRPESSGEPQFTLVTFQKGGRAHVQKDEHSTLCWPTAGKDAFAESKAIPVPATAEAVAAEVSCRWCSTALTKSLFNPNDPALVKKRAKAKPEPDPVAVEA